MRSGPELPAGCGPARPGGPGQRDLTVVLNQRCNPDIGTIEQNLIAAKFK
jgi:hypothetical protein